jgi:hypothetical protein
MIMWSTEHRDHSPLDRKLLWATFTDIHAGRLTLPGGDRFEADGPLGVGTRLAVTPSGQETMTSTITEFEPSRRYADVTEFDGLTLTFSHDFVDEPGPAGGTTLTHRLVIDGPGADRIGPELGPQISADFPEQMRQLFVAAGNRR